MVVAVADGPDTEAELLVEDEVGIEEAAEVDGRTAAAAAAEQPVLW